MKGDFFFEVQCMLGLPKKRIVLFHLRPARGIELNKVSNGAC